MYATLNESNKMIKITQFNSNLIINDQRNSNKQRLSLSPQKHYNVKKLSEFKIKPSAKPYRII